jgi:VIT1/CCC1 family predicted Fe2+/Mn2+ transporter
MAIGEYVSVSAQKDAEKSADLEELTSPIQASVYSFVSFAVGAGIPLGAVAIAPHVVTAIVGVIVALLITAFVSAYVAKGSLKLALLRNLGGGIIALVLGVILNIGFSV